MTFWGVKVKPSDPYVHRNKTGLGRLCITQATLADCGSRAPTMKKSMVKCTIGHESRPILICSLLPERAETCSLHLEFEEEKKPIVFNVDGPRSVYLSGYYLNHSNRQSHFHFNKHSDINDDDSNSYGEDIAETESDQSGDGYSSYDSEDTFINDGDIEIEPPSPQPKTGVTGRNSGLRRLKKKYEVSYSDENDHVVSQQLKKKTTAPVITCNSEDEDDTLFISSFYKRKPIFKKSDKKTAEKENVDDDNYQVICSKRKRKIDAVVQQWETTVQPCDSSLASNEDGTRNTGTPKKKKKNKKRTRDEDLTMGDNMSNACKENEGHESKGAKINDMNQDLAVGDESKTKQSIVDEKKEIDDKSKLLESKVEPCPENMKLHLLVNSQESNAKLKDEKSLLDMYGGHVAPENQTDMKKKKKSKTSKNDTNANT